MPTDKEFQDFLNLCLNESKTIPIDQVPSKKGKGIFDGFDVTQIKPSNEMKDGDEDNGIMGDDNSVGLY